MRILFSAFGVDDEMQDITDETHGDPSWLRVIVVKINHRSIPFESHHGREFHTVMLGDVDPALVFVPFVFEPRRHAYNVATIYSDSKYCVAIICEKSR